MPPITLDELTEDTDSFVPALPESQKTCAAADVLRSLRHGTNRTFLRTARRAHAARTPLLETTLAWCATSCDPSVARRARYVLSLLRRNAAQT